MRLIGHIGDEKAAERFGDYLYLEGIENDVEKEDNGSHGIWVHEEEHLDNAVRMLEAFRENPDAAQYHGLGEKAAKHRSRAFKQERKAAERTFEGHEIFGRGTVPMRVTNAILSICIALFAVELVIDTPHGLGQWLYLTSDVFRGQIWRLVTPALLHGSFLHILFNLLWWKDLGGMMERAQGPRFLLAFFLVTAISSNLAEFFVSGPLFRGLSGVVYGLLGYVWVRARFDPGSGYFIHPTTMMFMMIWFFMCLSGAIGGIANTVHFVGLATGAAWGYSIALGRFK